LTICYLLIDYLAVEKSRLKTTPSRTTLFGHIAEVFEESVITSIGFPWSYVGDQSYKWIVKFDDDNYVKLIFTNISFHKYAKVNDIYINYLTFAKNTLFSLGFRLFMYSM
jgi:hypothetical protein